jgi:hypothetical protein
MNAPFAPANVKGIGAIPHIKRAAPGVFCCLARSTNGNIVVMEADKVTGIHFYWLDLEPSYKDAARKKNRVNDRDEFGRLDHIAYGHTQEKQPDHTYIVRMKQLARYPIHVRFVGNKAKAYVTYNSHEYILDFIYVNQKNAFTYEVDAYVINELTGQRETIRAN